VAMSASHSDDSAKGHGAHADGHADHPDHKAEGGHGHGGMPHESPRAMTWVLATLAIGCLLTVGLGFWAPIGITPALEQWLHPVLAPSHHLVESRLDPTAHNHGLEYTLIFASVAVAFAGWFAARTLYKDAKSTIPATLAAKYPGLHKVVYNKYYVDEFYKATVLNGSMVVARAFSFFDKTVVDGLVNAVAVIGKFVCNIEGAIDKYLVDGAVNALAGGVLRGGKLLRRMQTGRIQHYLYAAMAGALLVAGINFLIK
jgi:NADH-quinone oxidoreductase subunit L